MRNMLASLALAAGLAVFASAQLVVTTTQGEEANLAHTFSNSDLIAGKLPIEVDPAPPYGLDNPEPWHPANADPNDKLPAFTDGIGMRFTGLTGLLRDYASEYWTDQYCIKVTYDLGATTDVGELRVFSGNNGRDGRVFHTYLLEASSTSSGDNFTVVQYVQSHPSGTVNKSDVNNWRAVETSLTSTDGIVVAGARRIRLTFWSVTDINEQKLLDPFLGTNPYTGVDDGVYSAGETPYQSPLIWEIDVFKAVVTPSYTGKITLEDFAGDVTQVPVTVELRQGGSVMESHTVALAADGSYSFKSNLSGTYDVTAKASHWLRAKKAGVAIGSGASGLDLSLVNGDVDGDNVVTVFDYNALSDAFDTAPGDGNWNPEADLDGDDAVTVFDYNILSNNFDLVGEE